MNPLRSLYGGSDRPQHLAINTLATASLTGVAVAFCLHGMPYAVAAPIGCRLFELWASPDRDLQENRKVQGYWGTFGRRVKHHSPYSHSLPLGTPIRLLYGFWFALPCVMVFPMWALWFVLGAIASDFAHFALDIGPRLSWRQVLTGKK